MRLTAAGRIRSVAIYKLLSANVYNYSGSKLEIGGQFAYQTALRRCWCAGKCLFSKQQFNWENNFPAAADMGQSVSVLFCMRAFTVLSVRLMNN